MVGTVDTQSITNPLSSADFDFPTINTVYCLSFQMVNRNKNAKKNRFTEQPGKNRKISHPKPHKQGKRRRPMDGLSLPVRGRATRHDMIQEKESFSYKKRFKAMHTEETIAIVSSVSHAAIPFRLPYVCLYPSDSLPSQASVSFRFLILATGALQGDFRSTPGYTVRSDPRATVRLVHDRRAELPL